MTDKPKRRWLQFSLRTLFVVVTVFCIWVGITAKRAREQRLAVEAILELGGTVFYDFHYYEEDGETSINPSREPSSPKWLRDWLGLDLFHRVRKVQAVKLLQIPQFPSGGIHFLGPMPQATQLSQRIDEHMVHLAALHDLETLDLSHSDLTDAGLGYVTGFTNLQYLNLRNTDVTEDSVKKFQQSLPNCQIIYP